MSMRFSRQSCSIQTNVQSSVMSLCLCSCTRITSAIMSQWRIGGIEISEQSRKMQQQKDFTDLWFFATRKHSNVHWRVYNAQNSHNYLITRCFFSILKVTLFEWVPSLICSSASHRSHFNGDNYSGINRNYALSIW